MGILRSELQLKITNLKKTYPDADFAFLKSQLSAWLDTKELSNISFSQDEMRDRILDDLSSYEGVVQ